LENDDVNRDPQNDEDEDEFEDADPFDLLESYFTELREYAFELEDENGDQHEGGKLSDRYEGTIQRLRQLKGKLKIQN